MAAWMGTNFAEEGDIKCQTTCHSFPKFIHHHPIPHRKNATLMVAVRGCASPIERYLSRLRITVMAQKRILPCLCMTPLAPIRTPKSALTWLMDSPAFVLTGSSNATIRKYLAFLVRSMPVAGNETC